MKPYTTLQSYNPELALDELHICSIVHKGPWIDAVYLPQHGSNSLIPGVIEFL